MSTSPTLISSRRKSSVRMLPSVKPILHSTWRSLGARPRSGSDPSQAEPVELVGAHGQQIGQIADARENIPAKHLDQNIAFIGAQIKLHGLRGTGQIVYHQDGVFPELSHISQHPVVRRIKELDRSPAKERR